MLEAASFAGVSEIVLLGDYADFYSVSAHDKSANPKLPGLLLDEVMSVNQGLDELDKLFPEAKKVFLEGNHEYRLERYIAARAPALFGATECVNLFRMSSRPRWSYLPYTKNQGYRVLGSSLIAKHTPLASSAMNGLKRAMASVCYGHNHRIEVVYHVGLDGETHVAFSPGWLGDERLKAFDYMANQPNWQLGFALVYVNGSQKTFHHEIVHIKPDYSCVVQGKRLKA